MLLSLFMMIALQPGPVDDLAAEGERLGRYSTLFAVCAPYYTVDLAVGQSLAEDFERRSTDAGWTADQRMSAYDRGRELERAEIGIIMNAEGVTPRQARRHLRQMLPRLQSRCQALAREVPGSIADVDAGDQRVDAMARGIR
ncbi:MAG: hypothetical protein ACI8U3_002336 [Brevundimonas sp.]|jgi:hypothetical protein|uniref:hypothetical protein n=1 Tax=Brevundimonas sp. TaxID=1871086 RepID=UPI0039E21F85